ncbi:phage tail terminator-like protein [Brevundimonas sp. LjRoot202]|uniref:phage tail terminator-like protein n=1 Tax=Brevundimonas sp. LjRoot202 TaxID=3342281 RepID=UPI003ECC3AB6
MALAADVAKALLDRATSLTHGSPVMKKAMPDVTFTPETGQPYFRVDHFPNAPFWAGLANGRIDQGLLQITVVWPKGLGIIKASAAVDAVKAHFPKALLLTEGTARVKIGEAWHSSPLPGDAWTDTPVTIPWKAS